MPGTKHGRFLRRKKSNMYKVTGKMWERSFIFDLGWHVNVYFILLNHNWSYYWLASNQCSLGRANNSLSVCFCFQERKKPIFFFLAQQGKQKMTVRLWEVKKDSQVLMMRIAASFPNLEGDREEQRHGHCIIFPSGLMVNMKAVSHFASRLCITVSDCSDVQYEVLTNRQGYKQWRETKAPKSCQK